MSNRFTQPAHEAKRNQEQVRALLKLPQNKLCADCKRNDPRWASTSCKVWVCIRCSGIHRAMGVHISRIRSVDLDSWTTQQVDAMTAWSNDRANAYWEAHLKPGHLPPDHKIESFIRSKYELRRWALDGPMPEPDQLPTGAKPSSTPATAPAPTRKSAPTTSIDLLSAPPSSSTRTSSRSGSGSANPAAAPAPASLFDLDFSSAPAPPSAASSPAPTATPTPAAAKRDPKADILSLFNAAPAPSRAAPASTPASGATNGGAVGTLTGGLAGLSFGSNGGGGGGGPAPPVPSTAFDTTWGGAAPAPTSSGGDGFGDFGSAPPAAPGAVTAYPWRTSASTAGGGGGGDGIWGASSSTSSNGAGAAAAGKADPFADFGAFASPPASSSAHAHKSGAGAGGYGADIWGAPAPANGTSTNGNGGGGAASGGGFSDIWG